MQQILLTYLYITVLPLFFGALLRLIVGRRKYAWLVSLSALLLTAALAIYASTNPIPGNEGAGIRAIQSCCLFIGSVTTGRILWLKR